MRRNEREPELAPGADVERPASRRRFILAGIGVMLGGCAQTSKVADSLPDPGWDGAEPRVPTATETVYEPPVRSTPVDPTPPAPRGVIGRSAWASGRPVPALMDRMKPVRYVTVHHDGMHPFFGSGRREAAARLDAIRRAHRRAEWGDIGYHFAVDRAGNVWAARPVAYQGAHVKDHNEGNIGIVVLGNFDYQQPSTAQLEALHGHVGFLMTMYRVPVRNVRTHQEWAATACPGRHLQRVIVASRSNGRLG